MARQTATENALIDALDDHTDTESAGEGGPDKVACWLTADAIKNRLDDVVSNLTLLAEAHGYEYYRGSMQSSGYILVFDSAE